MAKPKPIQVGVIACTYHPQQPIQARVKKSLVTNKLFIDCPACGLIMPTLANFQEYVKNNAVFNDEFKPVFNPAVDKKPEYEENQNGQQEAAIEQEKATENKTPAAAAQPPTKPAKVKSDYEQEMGF